MRDIWIHEECYILSDHLCGLVVRRPGYISRGPGFDSRRYHIFWAVVGLERGPLSLVSITEELLEWKSSGRLPRRVDFQLAGWTCGQKLLIVKNKLLTKDHRIRGPVRIFWINYISDRKYIWDLVLGKLEVHTRQAHSRQCSKKSQNIS
jgi:hypothetical protein